MYGYRFTRTELAHDGRLPSEDLLVAISAPARIYTDHRYDFALCIGRVRFRIPSKSRSRNGGDPAGYPNPLCPSELWIRIRKMAGLYRFIERRAIYFAIHRFCALFHTVLCVCSAGFDFDGSMGICQVETVVENVEAPGRMSTTFYR